MSEHNSLVATFVNHKLARATVRKLHESGFDMKKLCIVAQDEDEQMSGATVVRDLSELGWDQLSCIPRENLPDYAAELKVDRMLLVAHGSPDEIYQARSVIDASHPEAWDGNVGCSIYYGCAD